VLRRREMRKAAPCALVLLAIAIGLTAGRGSAQATLKLSTRGTSARVRAVRVTSGQSVITVRRDRSGHVGVQVETPMGTFAALDDSAAMSAWAHKADALLTKSAPDSVGIRAEGFREPWMWLLRSPRDGDSTLAVVVSNGALTYVVHLGGQTLLALAALRGDVAVALDTIRDGSTDPRTSCLEIGTGADYLARSGADCTAANVMLAAEVPGSGTLCHPW